MALKNSESISILVGGTPRGIMVNVLNCDIIENEVESKSHYNVRFRTDILEKGMYSHILLAIG